MSQTLERSAKKEVLPLKPFEPGTLGWLADDLDKPEYQAALAVGRFEIFNGVLVKMPAAYYKGNAAAFRLMVILANLSSDGQCVPEVDLVLAEDRVLVADVVWLTPEDIQRHRAECQKQGRADPDKTRFLVPPTLVIESVSTGHDRHDRVTKFRWYAEFGVPNYWIIDGFARTLDCFKWVGGNYQRVAGGSANEQVAIPIFEPAVVDLSKLWL